MEYKSTTLNSFEKGSKMIVFPFTIYCLLKSFSIACEIWTIKSQQMAKISEQVPNKSLDTSRLSHIF